MTCGQHFLLKECFGPIKMAAISLVHEYFIFKMVISLSKKENSLLKWSIDRRSSKEYFIA